MIKNITKIGNSRELILDDALLEFAELKEGDKVNVEVQPNGTITITPITPEPTAEQIDATVEETMDGYTDTLGKLDQ